MVSSIKCTQLMARMVGTICIATETKVVCAVETLSSGLNQGLEANARERLRIEVIFAPLDPVQFQARVNVLFRSIHTVSISSQTLCDSKWSQCVWCCCWGSILSVSCACKPRMTVAMRNTQSEKALAYRGGSVKWAKTAANGITIIIITYAWSEKLRQLARLLAYHFH